jgi:lipopolysaccharide assembly outer membrane protein LptD (OstA)
MKLALAALALAALPLAAQEMKHLAVPTETSVRSVDVSAREVTRDLPHNSIIHLKGDVEIRTPVCTRNGTNNEMRCDGSVVLRADEADFHEDSGQIDARGNVTVTREPYPQK